MPEVQEGALRQLDRVSELDDGVGEGAVVGGVEVGPAARRPGAVPGRVVVGVLRVVPTLAGTLQPLHHPASRPGILQVVREDVHGAPTWSAERCPPRRQRARLEVHLRGPRGIAYRGAVRHRQVAAAGQVGTGRHEPIGQVEVVGGRRQPRRDGLVEDAGGARLPDAGHVVAAEGAAVGHEHGGLVAHTAVAVDAAIIAGVVLPARAAHPVRVPEAAGILHVPEGAAGRVLTDEPARRRRVGAGWVGKVQELAEDVGQ